MLRSGRGVSWELREAGGSEERVEFSW